MDEGRGRVPDIVPKPGGGTGGEIPITTDVQTKLVDNSRNLEVHEPASLRAKIEMVVSCKQVDDADRHWWHAQQTLLVRCVANQSGGWRWAGRCLH